MRVSFKIKLYNDEAKNKCRQIKAQLKGAFPKNIDLYHTMCDLTSVHCT